jgi:DNA-binding MarR family transcriptional regulator
MSSRPTFSTQLIGQTEKTLNAILGRLLADTGLDEPRWVTLTVAVMSGGSADREAFASQIAGSVHITEDEARARIDELTSAGLLEEGSPIRVTDAGKRLQARIRSAVVEITDRLWGDLPPDDLTAASRVLTTVLERANGELARI